MVHEMNLVEAVSGIYAHTHSKMSSRRPFSGYSPPLTPESTG
jgi:hypothetical protein